MGNMKFEFPFFYKAAEVLKNFMVSNSSFFNSVLTRSLIHIVWFIFLPFLYYSIFNILYYSSAPPKYCNFDSLSLGKIWFLCPECSVTIFFLIHIHSSWTNWDDNFVCPLGSPISWYVICPSNSWLKFPLYNLVVRNELL